MKKLIMIAMLVLTLIGCSNNKEEDPYKDQSLEILKVIQANMSEEQFNYKIDSVKAGINLWQNNIPYEYTTLNDHDFLIYFTDRDCFVLPEIDLYPFCLQAQQTPGQTTMGFAHSKIRDGAIYKGYVILFNDTFESGLSVEDISKVVAHEIGHIYGFGHYDNYPNVMSTYYHNIQVPNPEYINLLKNTINLKSVPAGEESKFLIYPLPPKVEVKFFIQTLSARTE